MRLRAFIGSAYEGFLNVAVVYIAASRSRFFLHQFELTTNEC